MDKCLFYYLAQARAVGSPIGLPNTILTREFSKDALKGGHGYLPWYAGPKRKGGPVTPFPPEELCLISFDRRLRFDLRSIGGYQRMYAMSQRCFECLQDLKTGFNDFVQVSLVDRSGISLSSLPYQVGRLHALDLLKVADQPRSQILKSGYHHFIQQIEFLQDMDFDVFSIAGISPVQDSLFASERAKLKFSEFGIKGVQFVPLNDRDWSIRPQIGYPDILDMMMSRSSYYNPL